MNIFAVDACLEAVWLACLFAWAREPVVRPFCNALKTSGLAGVFRFAVFCLAVCRLSHRKRCPFRA